MAGLALVFAGQGAQFVGMGRDLAEKHAACGELFRKADAVLGYKLSGICFDGPEEALTRSDYCQPAIFVVSVACYTALCLELGRKPEGAGMAGLSLGEWTALHVAGALSFEDALRILSSRGRFMQEACEERDGAMVSVIGLPIERVREVSSAAGVEISNLNSAGQTVLSGERPAIMRAEEMAKAAGAKKTVVLKVAGAYHSSLMKSAADKLQAMLAGVKLTSPAVPVLSNVTGLPHGGPDEIRQQMVRQVTGSVQWVSCVNWLKGKGIGRYLELGPGRVLGGLIKRVDASADVLNVQDVPTLEKARQALTA